MLRNTQSGAKNNASHARFGQDVIGGDISDTHGMLLGDILETAQQFLEELPPAPSIDHLFIFLKAGCLQRPLARLTPAKKLFRQQPAAHCPIGQQLDVMRLAKRDHLDLWPAVNQGELDLIGNDGDVVLGNDSEMLSIKVGQGKMANLAFFFEIGEVFECIQIAFVAVVPPVKLQEIKRLHIHAT